MATSEVATNESDVSTKFYIYLSRLSTDTLHLGLPLMAVGLYQSSQSHTARILMLSAFLYLTVINWYVCM